MEVEKAGIIAGPRSLLVVTYKLPQQSWRRKLAGNKGGGIIGVDSKGVGCGRHRVGSECGRRDWLCLAACSIQKRSTEPLTAKGTREYSIQTWRTTFPSFLEGRLFRMQGHRPGPGPCIQQSRHRSLRAELKLELEIRCTARGTLSLTLALH
ncbi:hypothetical protein NCU06124 [Neurospora crassa OR74A]|uniref:Uncharacterized protein n=1 Tax=Neurospora crassa (strain ATCC 24698 / 74-OR23-1A / CBS 708.71 / DSM 1257 / FGSC 987) TaxID=367110 RepID=Q7S5G4_NEUCR|nr:hypothetical protein NCU06124 [Neurospora crassa OR74A]EAA30750.1 hypothetical protein NCU06124 [Neurospora crassa OR74A]|eukprot:XP_959986.1 hypothetical protein NCU06124 [Neurospora crassa OR74A]